jgi:hypothetical protein
MKATEIRTGVAYSYQARWHDKPKPVVFLSTGLYQTANSPWAVPADPRHKKPLRGYHEAVGYVAAEQHWTSKASEDDAVKQMLALTEDDIARVHLNRLGEDIEVSLVTSTYLGCIRGIFWEEAEAHSARVAREQKRADERAAVLGERNARFAAVAAVFHRNDLTVPRFDDGSARLTMSLASAERVAALLEKLDGARS